MNNLCKKPAVRWAAPVVWMGLIFYLSAQSRLPNLTPGLPGFEEIAGHLSVFAVLAGLWWWALSTAGMRHAWAWAFVITVAYGASDEYHQSFVPGRTPDIFDLAMDATGAAAALAVAVTCLAPRLALARRSRRPVPDPAPDRARG